MTLTADEYRSITSEPAPEDFEACQTLAQSMLDARTLGFYNAHDPDTLPALVNGVRAFAIVGAVSLLWIATAWPSGVTALIFAMVVVIAQGPRGPAQVTPEPAVSPLGGARPAGREAMNE